MDHPLLNKNKQRGGAMVEEDTWLDPDASYRSYHLPLPGAAYGRVRLNWTCEEKPTERGFGLIHFYKHNQQPQKLPLLLTQHGQSTPLPMVGGDVQPIWFRWDEETKAWEPFHPHECRRLERAYRGHLKGQGHTGGGKSISLGAGGGYGRGGHDGRVMSWGEASAVEEDSDAAAPVVGSGACFGVGSGWYVRVWVLLGRDVVLYVHKAYPTNPNTTTTPGTRPAAGEGAPPRTTAVASRRTTLAAWRLRRRLLLPLQVLLRLVPVGAGAAW
jgi:hypothetical protein